MKMGWLPIEQLVTFTTTVTSTPCWVNVAEPPGDPRNVAVDVTSVPGPLSALPASELVPESTVETGDPPEPPDPPEPAVATTSPAAPPLPMTGTPPLPPLPRADDPAPPAVVAAVDPLSSS